VFLELGPAPDSRTKPKSGNSLAHCTEPKVQFPLVGVNIEGDTCCTSCSYDCPRYVEFLHESAFSGFV